MKKQIKLTDSEQVQQYMDALDHPLKHAVEAVRSIIKSHPKIKERIKWNAPSYYTSADLLTFHLRNPKLVHLVFHHPEIVNIQSPLLEGDYKDRRMMYFTTLEATETHKAELKKIINAYIEKVG